MSLFQVDLIARQEYTVNAKQRDSLDVPMIRRAADKTLDVVHNVEWKLPDILSQLIDIKRVYDLGRRRVRTCDLAARSF